MVQDDETRKETMSRHIDLNEVHNPSIAICERLAMVDLAFGDLHAQVHVGYSASSHYIMPIIFFGRLWNSKFT